jgi:hypothetical protein
MSLPRRLVLLAALVLQVAPARAEPVSKKRRAAAVGASIVPGVLIHGAGHWVAGERRVARRLLLIEGIGLGAAVTAGVPLVLTGASRHSIAAPIALLVSGVGVAAISWMADIYGASGAGCTRKTPALPAPIEVELGYGHVYEPRFDYRSFAVASASAELGAFRIAPSAWVGLDDDNQRLRLEGGYRLAGRSARWPTGDASSLEVVSAATHHRYPDDGFAVSTGELSLAGRLDMRRIGDSLAGSFADLSVGLAGEVTNYYTPGAGADLGQMLLARFGYGIVIGHPGGLHGEATLYYDHRRDTFPGGISPGSGPGSGFMGFFGAEALLYVGPRWGVRARVEQGAASVAHIGLVTRFGGPR